MGKLIRYRVPKEKPLRFTPWGSFFLYFWVGSTEAPRSGLDNLRFKCFYAFLNTEDIRHIFVFIHTVGLLYFHTKLPGSNFFHKRA